MSTISLEKDVWVVWSNTDLTEGRGVEYPLAICTARQTAIRLSHKKGVQGTDARITKDIAYLIQPRNLWAATFRLHAATADDITEDNRRDNREAALAKAKAAGLTDEEIELLRGKP